MSPPIIDVHPRVPHHSPGARPSVVSTIAHALVLAGATAAVFLAGKPQEGAMGIFLLCAGAAMLVCPPRVKVGWPLWIVAAALAGCAALALLPASLLSQPVWRQTLAATPQITLPATISTTPALTIFWLAVLALTLCVGLFLLAHPIRSRRMLVLALAASLAAAVYGGMAIYAKQTGWRYPFAAAEVDFGFFPNHNHTATLLFVGNLLAVGCLGVLLREGRWLSALLAGACLTVCGAGLTFYSASRGGVLFLLVGVGVWFLGLGRRQYDTRLVVSFLALLAAGAVLFVLSGGTARDRLLGKATAPPTAHVSSPASTDTADDRGAHLTEDFRLNVYRDASGVVRDYPLTGVGLGNFALIFPQYRHASLRDARVIHPESDWLMLTAEAGLPAVICALVLLGLALGRLRGETGHPYWPLRWGCAVAAGAAALHGLVDVPLHRVQLGWWVLAVGGLALQSFLSGQATRSRVQHGLFVVAGFGALILGGKLVRAQWFGGEPLPPFVAAETEREIVARFERHDVNGATDLAHETLQAYPMSPALYRQLGTLLLQFQNTDAEADDVFKAERLLDPNLPAIPLQQGDIWRTIDPDRTAALWLDALARQQRIEVASGHTPDAAVNYYQELLRRAAPVPAVARKLAGEAARSPAYAFAWLDQTGPRIEPADWERFSGSAELLKRFSEGDRRRFLLTWYTKGDRAALARFVADHPDWETAARPIHLRELIDGQQFETVVREEAARYHVSLDLPAPDPNAAPGTTAEDADPARAFVQYWTEGNAISARRVLSEGDANTGGAPRNAEFYRLKAALAVHDANWPEAWGNLQRFIGIEHPEVGF